jgi:hypothetical protein
VEARLERQRQQPAAALSTSVQLSLRSEAKPRSTPSRYGELAKIAVLSALTPIAMRRRSPACCSDA